MAPFVCANLSCRSLLPTRRKLEQHYAQHKDCQKSVRIIKEALQRRVRGSSVEDEPMALDAEDEPMALDDQDPGPVDHEEVVSDSPSPPHRSVTVEEAEDEEDHGAGPWLEEDSDAGAPLGRTELPFEKQRKAHADAGQAPWAPFSSSDEWQFADWMMQSGISQGEMVSEELPVNRSQPIVAISQTEHGSTRVHRSGKKS